MITLTSNGNSTLDITQGGNYFLDVNGTFSSGTVAVQISLDAGTTYVPLTTAVGTDLAVNADYNAVITLPKSKIKFVLTGASSPSLKIHLAEID